MRTEVACAKHVYDAYLLPDSERDGPLCIPYKIASFGEYNDYLPDFFSQTQWIYAQEALVVIFVEIQKEFIGLFSR